MDHFYRTHKYLLTNTKPGIRRGLMDEIDWSDRLIGIKGSRGVGKTTFLLDCAREKFSNKGRSCLYINLNTFYFSQHSLVDFVDEFRQQGGRVLLLDQVYKYPDWSKDLSYCFEHFKDVKIIFSASSVQRLKEENMDLSGKVKSYNLRGFSFREYLTRELKIDLPSFSLEDLLENHKTIAKDICCQLNPLAYFNDYLHHGYYPIYVEPQNYSEHLLRIINMMMEIDISCLRQIELKYLPKLRKLFYLVAIQAPATINISRLSKEVGVSRATVMNYLTYLKDARLFNLLYGAGDELGNKPERVYLHNTNLVHVLANGSVERKTIGETFLYNMLHKDHRVNSISKKGGFIVNDRLRLDVDIDERRQSKIQTDYLFLDGLEQGYGTKIPLWLLGFIY